MVLHRVIASQHPDNLRVGRDPELPSHLGSRVRVRTEPFDIEPVGNDECSFRWKADRGVLRDGQPRVVEDPFRPTSKPGAQSQQGTSDESFAGEVVDGPSDIPKHGYLQSRECCTHGRGQISLEEPALHKIRAQLAEPSSQSKWRSHEVRAIHSQRRLENSQLANSLHDSATATERKHDMLECRPARVAHEPSQHRLRPADRQRVDDVNDARPLVARASRQRGRDRRVVRRSIRSTTNALIYCERQQRRRTRSRPQQHSECRRPRADSRMGGQASTRPLVQ